ncbi:MAG TPA: type II secretion system protein [Noviherbaspirillum sp.]|nr:type II secretion system protein [Noviherbaspirillum sp.]
MKKQQSGFTLIELVVVIVILGILAATALPKFVDLSNDARGGVMRGLEGSMRSADTMIYAKAAAAGIATKDAGTGVSVSVNGQTILTKFGYAKDATELAKALTLNPAADFDATNAARIAHAKAKDYSTAPATCAVIYTPAADANTAPTYVVDTTGC